MQIKFECRAFDKYRDGGLLFWKPPLSLIKAIQDRDKASETTVQTDLTYNFSSTIERFMRLFCLLNLARTNKEVGKAVQELNDAMKRIAKKHFSEDI